MMADMVDDDLGRGSAAWFTRALAVQKQHQTPPEIELMPPVIGFQWTISGDYIAGGGLRTVTARSTHSIKPPTKRPRSEKPGAAGDNYCSLNDRPGGCHSRNCPWEDTRDPNCRASNGGGGTGGGLARNHGAGNGDRGGASDGDSGGGGRGSAGNSLSDGGGGGGGSNSGVGHGGGGPYPHLGTRARPHGRTDLGQPAARAFDGDAVKEEMRSGPNMQKGRGINEDTDTSAVSECKIGHVLWDAIWRIWYLYGMAVVNAAGEMTTEPNGVTKLEAPLFCCFCSRHLEHLSAMRVETAWGGFCLESGWWGE